MKRRVFEKRDLELCWPRDCFARPRPLDLWERTASDHHHCKHRTLCVGRGTRNVLSLAHFRLIPVDRCCLQKCRSPLALGFARPGLSGKLPTTGKRSTRFPPGPFRKHRSHLARRSAKSYRRPRVVFVRESDSEDELPSVFQKVTANANRVHSSHRPSPPESDGPFTNPTVGKTWASARVSWGAVRANRFWVLKGCWGA